jgi:hypothetical protein
MDNMHEPSSGEPQDFWPTQEMGPRLVGPGQHPEQASQPAAAAAPPPPPASPRRHRAVWWGAGIALVAMLAGGGVAAAELSSSSSPAPGGPTGQAATLNTLLNSASSPTSDSTLSSASAGSASPACLSRAAKLRAEGHTVAARIVLRFCRHRLLRLRLLGGEHGEVTFNSKTGPRTLAFERGVIQSVSSSGVVVQAKDGTTWTWTLQGNTVIRHDGQRVTDASLSDGERVFAAGPVVGSSYDARLIVVAANASPTPSPSPSASGS